MSYGKANQELLSIPLAFYQNVSFCRNTNWKLFYNVQCDK